MTEEMALTLDGAKIAMRYPLHLSSEEKNAMRATFQEHLDRLCPELHPVLLQECESGNWVCEVWSGWPHPDSVYIMLGMPFFGSQAHLPIGLEFTDIGDPHYWKSDITCLRTHHAIACRFAM